MPKISVIIPTYNYCKYIGKAIDSVLEQTYQDTEIIVVDDGSTDNTYEIIRRKYKQKIKYFYQENQGAPVARNFGIHQATGEYISFLDADDWLLPESLSTRMSYLHNHPADDWVYSNWNVVDSNGNLFGTADQLFLPPSEKRQGNIFPMLLADGAFVNTLTPLVKKKDLLNIGGFRAGLEASQDYELWLRFSRKHKVGYVDKILAVQRIHISHISAHAEKRYLVQIQLISEYMNDPDGYEILKPVYKHRVSNIYNYLALIQSLSSRYRNAICSCLNSIKIKPIQLTALKIFWYILTRDTDKMRAILKNKTMLLYERAALNQGG